MTTTHPPTEAARRPKRSPGRFQPVRATLLLLLLSTGMFGYTATQALTQKPGAGHHGRVQASVTPSAVLASSPEAAGSGS